MLVIVGGAGLTAIVSGSAVASTTTKSTVAVLDSKTCVLTLADKTTYQFGKNCDFSKLKVGENIAIVWKPKGNLRVPVEVLVAP